MAAQVINHITLASLLACRLSKSQISLQLVSMFTQSDWSCMIVMESGWVDNMTHESHLEKEITVYV